MRKISSLIILTFLLFCIKRDFDNPYDPMNFPPGPSLIFPSKGDTIKVNPLVNLICKKVKSAENYEFILSEDSLFNKIILRTLIPSETLNVSEILQSIFKNKKIFWKVQAKNEAGYGNYSQVSYFYVKFYPLFAHYHLKGIYKIKFYKNYLILIDDSIKVYSIEDTLNLISSSDFFYYPLTIMDENKIISKYYNHIEVYYIRDNGFIDKREIDVNYRGHLNKLRANGDTLWFFTYLTEGWYIKDTTLIYLYDLNSGNRIDSFIINKYYGDFFVKDEYVFIPEGKNLKVIKFEPENDTFYYKEELTLSHDAGNIEKKGNYLIANFGRYITIIDISDPENIKIRDEKDFLPILDVSVINKIKHEPPDKYLIFARDFSGNILLLVYENGVLKGGVSNIPIEEFDLNDKNWFIKIYGNDVIYFFKI